VRALRSISARHLRAVRPEHAIRPLQPALDPVVAGLLAALTALVGVLLQRAQHPGLPFGVDMDLWSFTALDMGLGLGSTLPPAYPGLTALLARVTGAGTLDAATGVSAGAMAAVPALGWLLARKLGAGRPAALIAAFVPLATPGLLFEGHQITPDPLTAAVLLLLALAAATWAGRPAPLALGTLLLAVAALYVTREHGLVAAPLAVAVILLAPAPLWLRVLGAAGVGAAIWLAPSLCLHPPALPWHSTWWSRAALVANDALSDDPSWRAKPAQALVENTRLSLMGHALEGAPFGWAWLLLGLGGAALLPLPARAALAVGALPALPALFIFSQPRHVLVVVPVAAAVALAASRRLAGGARWILLAGAAAFGLAGAARTWDHTAWLMEGQVGETVQLRALGRAICALPEQGLIWSGDMRAFTFCPLPRFENSGRGDAALWKVLYAGDASPGEDFVRLDLPRGTGFEIHRLGWTSPGERPCLASKPAAGAPHIFSVARAMRLEPGCDRPPPPAAVAAIHQPRTPAGPAGRKRPPPEGTRNSSR